MNDTVTERRVSRPEIPGIGRRRLLSAALGLEPSAGAPSDGVAPDSEVVDRRRYSIAGLSSREEARRLERRLERLDQVVSARVRFDDGSAVISVRAARRAGPKGDGREGGIDQDLAFVAACAGYQLTPRHETPPVGFAARDARHAEVLRAAGLTSAFALALTLIQAGHQWADIYFTGTREIVTAAEVVLLAGALWFGRSLFGHSRYGNELVPRAGAAAYVLATGLALITVFVDFFADAVPRFDIPAVIVMAYHSTVLMMSLVLREAEAPYRRLLALRPERACVVREGSQVRIRARDVVAEDRVSVATGEIIPVDGVVASTDGAGLVDASELLGSGSPEPRREGDPVFAGSWNLGERLVVEPSGKENTLLVRLLRAIDLDGHRAHARSTTQQHGTPAGTAASNWAALTTALLPASLVQARDRLEAQYGRLGARHGKLVFFGALAAAASVLLGLSESGTGRTAQDLLGPAQAILVLASAFSVAWSPILATVSAVAAAARRGVLFRDASALKALTNLDVVVFAGAGTLTTGRLSVESVTTHADFPEREGLLLAIAAEHSPDDGVAVAVRDYVVKRFGDAALAEVPEARSFRRLPGQGVIAMVDDREVVVGRAKLIAAKGVPVPEGIPDDANTLVVAARRPGMPAAVVLTLRVADPVRPECQASRLHPDARPQVRLLVPEADHTADSLARRLGCGAAEVIAGDVVKHAEAVAALVASGKRVAVVGSVDQDALALAAATSSIGIIGRDRTLEEEVDVLLLRPGVGGYVVARGAARTARLGGWLGAISAVLAVGGFVPAWLGLLGPSAAAVVALNLVVVMGLLIRLHARIQR